MSDLHNQVLRRSALKASIPELEAKKAALEKELFSLYIDMHNQQADVDNLEAFSIKNWLLDRMGKKEELLAKEYSEARAAKQRHDAAKFELQRLTDTLAANRAELQSLRGCWRDYRISLTDRSAIAAQDALERTELEAALAHCTEAEEKTDDLLELLENLIERNQYGSGTINMNMPSYLATAQKRINQLSHALSLLVEDVSDLPTDPPVLEPDAVLLSLDEHLLEDLLSSLSRDAQLNTAAAALQTAKRSLQSIAAELKIRINSQLRQS